MLLVFHRVLELVLGQTLDDVGCLWLAPNIELVLVDEIGAGFALPLGRALLRRRPLLHLNIDVLSRVVVEGELAALSHVALDQGLRVNVFVVGAENDWLVVVSLVLLAGLAGGALILILWLHLLQVDRLHLVTVHRVV